MLVELKAIVMSGRGLATTLRAEDIAQLSKLQGIALKHGSLNLVGRAPVWLDTSCAIYSSNENIFYWHASLEGVPIILNRWRGCPAHVYEIFSENYLRTMLNLRDGDVVTISIPLNIINSKENARRRNRLIWYMTWSRRGELYYKNDRYLNFLKPFSKYLWRSNQF